MKFLGSALLLIATTGFARAQDTEREELEDVIRVDRPGDDGDITDELQLAITKALKSTRPTVVVPSGRWTVNDTIDLNPSRKFVHLSLRSEGLGIPYTSGDGVELQATFNDRPILAVQSMRGAAISGIRFVGQTQYPSNRWSEDVWDGLYVQDRHRQFCGIAIDPYSGDPPKGESHYEPRRGWIKSHSSMVFIRDCQFRFLGVGVITKPSGGEAADRQGDYLKIEDSNFQWCKYGVSVNGSQTRGNVFDGCHFWDCFAAIAGGLHGPQRCGPILASGRSSFDRVTYCVQARRAGYANAITLRDCEGEQIGSIADIREGHGVTKVTIDAVSFRFVADTDQSLLPQEHLWIDGCSATVSNNVLRIYQNRPRPTCIMRISGGTVAIRDNLFREVSPNNAPPFVLLPSGYPDQLKRTVQGNYRTDYVARLYPEGSGQRAVIYGARHVDGLTWTGSIRGDAQFNMQPGQLIASAHPTTHEVGLFRMKSIDPTSRTAEVESLLPGEIDELEKLLMRTDRYLYLVDMKN